MNADVLADYRRTYINWTRRMRHRPRARFTQVLFVPGRSGLPVALDPRRVYQLGEPAKWVVLECPCGRGHRVELNLAHPGRARWRLTTVNARDGSPSLSPSIDVRGNRRCHFWLRGGRVIWV